MLTEGSAPSSKSKFWTDEFMSELVNNLFCPHAKPRHGSPPAHVGRGHRKVGKLSQEIIAAKRPILSLEPCPSETVQVWRPNPSPYILLPLAKPRRVHVCIHMYVYAYACVHMYECVCMSMCVTLYAVSWNEITRSSNLQKCLR